MAAAAITPCSFETFLRPASFPGVSFIDSSEDCMNEDKGAEQAIVNQTGGKTPGKRRLELHVSQTRHVRPAQPVTLPSPPSAWRCSRRGRRPRFSDLCLSGLSP